MILNYIENPKIFIDYKNDKIHEVSDTLVFLYHLWHRIRMMKKKLMAF